MNLIRCHENLEIISVGCCEPRAYYVPFDCPVSMDTPREASKQFMLLNGTWDFAYYSSFEQYWETVKQGVDTIAFYDQIKVPSNWQIEKLSDPKIDLPQYLNTFYPFPFDPPYVPVENPVGVYARTFQVSKTAQKRQYLLFEGVDACFYVWLNGSFVGYSEIPHSTAEFDVTEYICEGDNRIVVAVLKWCKGTYLDNQDKFRLSGIFRDVYLLSRPEGHITDYTVTTPWDEENESISVAFQAKGQFHADTVLTLMGPDGKQLASSGLSEDGTAVFSIENPLFWTAETPVRYELQIRSAGEYIAEAVGLRYIQIRDSVLLFNGTAIKLHGVNRHDSDPESGFHVTMEQMARDLELMKRNNINAIRSSHYPNDPRFLQMCDKYGFYMIDEADLESHGVVTAGLREWPEAYDILADDPQWQELFTDRVRHLLQRDKNRPCVMMWSVGNESGWGCNAISCIEYLHAHDSTRPVHYERAASIGPNCDSHPGPDITSRMYAEPEWCEDYCTSGRDSRPMIQCEYCHAMGNGPGDLKDYWDLIWKYPQFAGGFVWEWCDHAISLGLTEQGRPFYAYGGDFNEILHDGCFCVDGLVQPDRTPSPGLYEHKYIVQPVHVEPLDMKSGKIRMTNRYDFVTLSHLECRYEVICDGKVTDSGILELPKIKAHASADIEVPYTLPKNGEGYLNLTFVQRDQDGFIQAGDEIAIAQLRLPTVTADEQAAKEDGCGKITWTQTAESIIISGENFCYDFVKATAVFKQLAWGGKDYLIRPMEFNVWRAPTDNDRNVRNRWCEDGAYDRCSSRAYENKIRQQDGQVQIESEISVAAAPKMPFLRATVLWTVYSDGEIRLETHVKPSYRMPVYLPRFGLRMFLDKSFSQTEYYGYGPYESYVDSHHASRIGLYQEKVSEAMFHYIRPQETGNHYASKWAEIKDVSGRLIRIEGQKFDFSALPYSQEELEGERRKVFDTWPYLQKNPEKNMHDHDLPESEHTVLCVDYMQSGIGSNSCGPELAEKYQIGKKPFCFAVAIKLGETK